MTVGLILDLWKATFVLSLVRVIFWVALGSLQEWEA